MALIKCKECGEIISDNAISCPYCGRQRKYPTPYYPDIEIIPHLDDDSYYDTKNHREISFGEYLMTESRYREECKKNRHYSKVKYQKMLEDIYERDNIHLLNH